VKPQVRLRGARRGEKGMVRGERGRERREQGVEPERGGGGGGACPGLRETSHVPRG